MWKFTLAILEWPWQKLVELALAIASIILWVVAQFGGKRKRR